MDKSEIAVSLFVMGQVQRVGLRKAVAERATILGVRGWAQNTTTKAVQIHAEGDREAVMQLVHEIQCGLARSIVESSFLVKDSIRSCDGFTIKAPAASEFQPFASEENERFEKSFSALKVVSKTLVNNFEKSLPHMKKDVACKLIENVPENFLSEWLARRYYSRNHNAGCSFTSSLWKQTRFRGALSGDGKVGNETTLNSKNVGYKFVDSLGVPLTKVLQKDVCVDEIVFADQIVVKPTSGTGSTGVYLVFNAAEQKCVLTREKFQSPDDLKISMRHLIEKGSVKKDSWIVEKMVAGADGKPAHDLKFYAFYGSAPLVLQVNRNDKPVRYCWWNRKLERASTGKYGETLFEPEPFPKEYFDIAEHVSRSVPVPFMRIDFLAGEDGLKFSEFTPRPGLFSNFNVQTDSMLGREFIEAQARLFKDIYLGKKFPEFDLVFEGERSKNKNS